MTVPRPFQPPRSRDLEEVLSEVEKPALLYFVEPSSNLCQLIEPAVVSVCENYEDVFQFIGCRMADFRDYFYEWHIHSCPAFILFREGEEIRRMANIKYRDDFKDRFHNFLVGDFLFDRSSFEYVDSVTFGHVINTGNYYHLMVFMKPGHPSNWKLKPALEQLQANHSAHLQVSLINAVKSKSLLNKYDINQLPAVLLYQKGELVKKWVPAYNPERLEDECAEILS
ncbi:MAG: thioredoxin domain-containing protein [bacterium]